MGLGDCGLIKVYLLYEDGVLDVHGFDDVATRGVVGLCADSVSHISGNCFRSFVVRFEHV